MSFVSMIKDGDVLLAMNDNGTVQFYDSTDSKWKFHSKLKTICGFYEDADTIKPDIEDEKPFNLFEYDRDLRQWRKIQ